MSANETHTPGPWTQWADKGLVYVGNITENTVRKIRGARACIADCERSDDELSKDEITANARLIASVPDLLAVCQRFSSLYGRLWDSADHEGAGFLSPDGVKQYDAVHNEMQVAICKATGAPLPYSEDDA